MPILKNSKDNYQHTLSKLHFQPVLTQQKDWWICTIETRPHESELMLWLQTATVLGKCCFKQLFEILTETGYVLQYCRENQQLLWRIGPNRGRSHDFYHVKRFECSRHTQCNSIDYIFPMLIYWLYVLLRVIARRAQYQLYNLSNLKFLAQERWPSLL